MKSENWKFKYIPERLEIVNIGSGPSLYDFEWENQSNKGYNLAVAPEDFRYDYRMVRTYLRNHLQKNGIVIHIISPLSFAENRYLSEDSFSLKYAKLLPFELVDLPRWKYFAAKYFPVIFQWKHLGGAAVRKLIHLRKKVEQNSYAYADSLLCGWLEQNPSLENFKDAGQVIRMKEAVNKNIAELQKTVQFCKENHYQYYAVIPPVSEYIRKEFSKEFLEEILYKNIRQAGIEDNQLLNYYDRLEYADMSCYTNGLFLAEAKRKEFTSQVIEDIQGR